MQCWWKHKQTRHTHADPLMTVISNFLSPLSPSSLYIKAGHPLAFSFPFSLTSMPRSLEYFSESPAFQFYSFIKATQQPLRLLHIKEAAPCLSVVFFPFHMPNNFFHFRFIKKRSSCEKLQSPQRIWKWNLSLKKRSGNTNTSFFPSPSFNTFFLLSLLHTLTTSCDHLGLVN